MNSDPPHGLRGRTAARWRVSFGICIGIAMLRSMRRRIHGSREATNGVATKTPAGLLTVARLLENSRIFRSGARILDRLRRF
jgi:hypothetical protein